MAERPYVSIDPAMRWGRPCLNSSRLPVEAVCERVWAGESVEEVARDYDITRPDVLVACWYLGTYGVVAPREHTAAARWRRRWGAWAESARGELWHSRYEIPDPPDSTERGDGA